MKKVIRHCCSIFLIWSFLELAIAQQCPNMCSGKGLCETPGRQCKCFEGYTGADCSLRTCPQDYAWVDIASGIDKAHQLAECSNMGLCDRGLGACICHDGFEGTACERLSCPNGCSQSGECRSMYYYAIKKDEGIMDDFERQRKAKYVYETPWDAFKIWGCDCDDSYHGIDCSLQYCPKGDDPLTGTGTSTSDNPNQFNEQQQVTCKAAGGFFTLAFRDYTTSLISYRADAITVQQALEKLPSLGEGSVRIVFSGLQACLPIGISWTVEFQQNFGSLPLLVPNTDKLFFPDALTKPVISVAKQVIGSKEDLECSGRGICDPVSGICSCNVNYATSNGYNSPGIRGDCGDATSVIQFCPGSISCSGHGVCAGNPTFRCYCSEGWTGSDCSQLLCPSDYTWFDYPESDNTAHISTLAECSGRGLCDRSVGNCACGVGFTGAACEFMSCPGISTLENPCNGHGQCLDMTTLATLATINGEDAGYTYGLVPNDPMTWDGRRVLGCHCDVGYEGYDCSLHSCPLGDDPGTEGQVDEVQTFSCNSPDQAGTVAFTFRDKTTIPLRLSDSLLNLETELEKLPTITEVIIYYNNPAVTTICGLGVTQQLGITFLTEHGDVPMMKINPAGTNPSTVMNIVESVRGNKENLVCSGRGLCDHSNGFCNCFPGFGSSDGKGNAGVIQDCGYLEPFEPLTG